MNINQVNIGHPNFQMMVDNNNNYVPVEYESGEGNLIRNTKSMLNELNSLKELTGEETMSQKS